MSDTNLGVRRAEGVKKASVSEAVEQDGTLYVKVTATFVVSHAAQCQVTEDTLAGLIERQGCDATNIDHFSIIGANND